MRSAEHSPVITLAWIAVLGVGWGGVAWVSSPRGHTLAYVLWVAMGIGWMWVICPTWWQLRHPAKAWWMWRTGRWLAAAWEAEREAEHEALRRSREPHRGGVPMVAHPPSVEPLPEGTVVRVRVPPRQMAQSLWAWDGREGRICGVKCRDPLLYSVSFEWTPGATCLVDVPAEVVTVIRCPLGVIPFSAELFRAREADQRQEELRRVILPASPVGVYGVGETAQGVLRKERSVVPEALTLSTVSSERAKSFAVDNLITPVWYKNPADAEVTVCLHFSSDDNPQYFAFDGVMGKVVGERILVDGQLHFVVQVKGNTVVEVPAWACHVLSE